MGPPVFIASSEIYLIPVYLARALIEQGNAVIQENEMDWLYTTAKMNSALTGSKITAVAADLRGNNAELSISLESAF